MIALFIITIVAVILQLVIYKTVISHKHHFARLTIFSNLFKRKWFLFLLFLPTLWKAANPLYFCIIAIFLSIFYKEKIILKSQKFFAFLIISFICFKSSPSHKSKSNDLECCPNFETLVLKLSKSQAILTVLKYV